MQTDFLEEAIRKIESIKLVNPIGKVSAIEDGQIKVTGLSDAAHMGDLMHIRGFSGDVLMAETVKIDTDFVTLMPDGPLSGLSLGAQVVPMSERSLAPCDEWLGRIVDPNGRPLDHKSLPKGLQDRPLHSAPPAAADRRPYGPRLPTGSFALNTLLPLVHGQRLGLFAGSGVGKSSLLGILAQNVPCDVIVIAMIGERGREIRHFTESVIGPEGMKKCVVVAATSERPALERRRCAWSAMTIAEHFRDQGHSVLFLADSVTRFAEAHREIASTAGESPSLQGHPPSSMQLITQLCERAGPGTNSSGDITAIFSVLVPGSDMEDPIADILRGVLDGHIVLDREIAERGRYPAISLLQSVSRSLPEAASKDENAIISAVRRVVSLYESNELVIRSGLHTEGADEELDTAIKIWPELDAFIGKCGPSQPTDCFDKLRLILRRAGVTY